MFVVVVIVVVAVVIVAVAVVVIVVVVVVVCVCVYCVIVATHLFLSSQRQIPHADRAIIARTDQALRLKLQTNHSICMSTELSRCKLSLPPIAFHTHPLSVYLLPHALATLANTPILSTTTICCATTRSITLSSLNSIRP